MDTQVRQLNSSQRETLYPAERYGCEEEGKLQALRAAGEDKQEKTNKGRPGLSQVGYKWKACRLGP